MAAVALALGPVADAARAHRGAGRARWACCCWRRAPGRSRRSATRRAGRSPPAARRARASAAVRAAAAACGRRRPGVGRAAGRRAASGGPRGRPRRAPGGRTAPPQGGRQAGCARRARRTGAGRRRRHVRRQQPVADRRRSPTPRQHGGGTLAVSSQSGAAGQLISSGADVAAHRRLLRPREPGQRRLAGRRRRSRAASAGSSTDGSGGGMPQDGRIGSTEVMAAVGEGRHRDARSTASTTSAGTRTSSAHWRADIGSAPWKPMRHASWRTGSASTPRPYGPARSATSTGIQDLDRIVRTSIQRVLEALVPDGEIGLVKSTDGPLAAALTDDALYVVGLSRITADNVNHSITPVRPPHRLRPARQGHLGERGDRPRPRRHARDAVALRVRARAHSRPGPKRGRTSAFCDRSPASSAGSSSSAACQRQADHEGRAAARRVAGAHAAVRAPRRCRRRSPGRGRRRRPPALAAAGARAPEALEQRPRAARSAGPGPWSRTSSSTSRPLRRTAISIGAPAGVCTSALPIRLAST